MKRSLFCWFYEWEWPETRPFEEANGQKWLVTTTVSSIIVVKFESNFYIENLDILIVNRYLLIIVMLPCGMSICWIW